MSSRNLNGEKGFGDTGDPSRIVISERDEKRGIEKKRKKDAGRWAKK